MSLTFEEKFNGIFSALILSLVLSMGGGGLYNYLTYNDKVIQQGERTKRIEMYGCISRLEVIHEKGLVKEISQISLLGNSKKFELDEKGLIKTITETGSNFLGKTKVKISNIGTYPQRDKERLNEDVKNYLKYLEKEK